MSALADRFGAAEGRAPAWFRTRTLAEVKDRRARAARPCRRIGTLSRRRQRWRDSVDPPKSFGMEPSRRHVEARRNEMAPRSVTQPDLGIVRLLQSRERATSRE